MALQARRKKELPDPDDADGGAESDDGDGSCSGAEDDAPALLPVPWARDASSETSDFDVVSLHDPDDPGVGSEPEDDDWFPWATPPGSPVPQCARCVLHCPGCGPHRGGAGTPAGPAASPGLDGPGGPGGGGPGGPGGGPGGPGAPGVYITPRGVPVRGDARNPYPAPVGQGDEQHHMAKAHAHHSRTYSAPKCRPLPQWFLTDGGQICLKAGCGTGKSTVVNAGIQAIRQRTGATPMFIGHRIALLLASREQHKNRIGLSAHWKEYANALKWRTDWPFYITVHSLRKLDLDKLPRPEILVLDEFTGILASFMFLGANAALAFDILRRLIQTAKWVIAADALADRDVAEALHILGCTEQTWIHNTAQVAAGWDARVYWHPARQASIAHAYLERAINSQRLLMIVSSHKRRLDAYMAAVEDKYPALRGPTGSEGWREHGMRHGVGSAAREAMGCGQRLRSDAARALGDRRRGQVEVLQRGPADRSRAEKHPRFRCYFDYPVSKREKCDLFLSGTYH
jgi:hypothetical protein